MGAPLPKVLCMQPCEVTSIERDHHPALRRREFELSRVGCSRAPDLDGRHDLEPRRRRPAATAPWTSSSKYTRGRPMGSPLHDHRPRGCLVGVLQESVDLGAVIEVVQERGIQVGRAQARVLYE
jgi:hypothetical protein